MTFFLFVAVQWIWAGIAYFFTLSAVTGTFGFICGLLLGLLVGYLIFICTLSMTVENPTLPSGFAGEDGEIDEKTLKRILPEMPIWVQNPDYDRVDWINTLIREMWPFIDKAVEAQVKVQTAPLLAKYKPAALESITFDALTLGTLPPTIAGIKVYNTTDDEMIIEPVLKWAGNPNIIVAAKAFGVKATVQLLDLTVFATARITLKPLVPVFPCFTKMTVSLMSKPTVDFGLKLIGGDLMAIPGLYTFVQETIKNVAANMLLWPKVLQLYKSEDAAAGKRPVGWLLVRKLAAKNLKNIERFGVIDPYVKLSFGHKLGSKMTTVKFNSLSPSWEGEEFSLLVKDPETQVLQLEVFDKETTSADKLIAVQQFPLKELVVMEPKAVELTLIKNLKANQPSTERLGTLCAELEYKPFNDDDEVVELDADQEAIPETVPYGGGLLRVTIHSGESLEGKNYTNPFVRVRFRGEQRNTAVMKKASDPDFDDRPFEFLVEEPPKEEELHVQVWSKNLSLMQYVNSKESIGFVDIPLRDVVANGRINDIYQLNESKNGKLKIELEWIEKKKPRATSVK